MISLSSTSSGILVILVISIGGRSFNCTLRTKVFSTISGIPTNCGSIILSNSLTVIPFTAVVSIEVSLIVVVSLLVLVLVVVELAVNS